MSIGVNQLLNAASYFILAYYMTEVLAGSKLSRASSEAKVPSSATYGVVAPWEILGLTPEKDTSQQLAS